MKKSLFGLAAVLVVAGASSIFIGASKPEATASPAPAAAMAATNWEYKTAAKVATKNIDETLKSLGDEGWELVAATMNVGGLGADSHNLFFKRPKN